MEAAATPPHTESLDWGALLGADCGPAARAHPFLASALAPSLWGAAPAHSPQLISPILGSPGLPEGPGSTHAAAQHPEAFLVPLQEVEAYAPSAARATAGGARLDALRAERTQLSGVRDRIPRTWTLLEAEIARLSSLPGAVCAGGVCGARRCVKLRVPAERYPGYNFVGRLLGPRGSTLKRLEAETGCRIMIRGRGSIRKDKEADVRGRPGWEHVFLEPLHVVVELATPLPPGADDAAGARALASARDLLAALLVPVPDDRDTLKRQQLRALALLNGTYRGPDLARVQTPPPHDPQSPRAAPAPVDILRAPQLPVDALRAPQTPMNAVRVPQTHLGRLRAPQLPTDVSCPPQTPVGILCSPQTPVDMLRAPQTPVDLLRTPQTPAEMLRARQLAQSGFPPHRARAAPAFCPAGRDFGVIGSAASIGSAVSVGSIGSALSVGDTPSL